MRRRDGQASYKQKGGSRPLLSISGLWSRLFRGDPLCSGFAMDISPSGRERVTRSELSRGFTLMELLIAMAILGILASVGYASFTISLQKSRDASRKSDLTSVAKALETYNNDFGVYPRSCNGTVGACSGGNYSCAWGTPFSDGNNVYMRQMPIESKNTWSYLYLVSVDQKSYQLYTRLENDKDPNYVTQVGTSCTAGADECTYGVSSANVDLQPPLSTSTCL